MDNIMKLVERVSKRYGGWDEYWKKKLVFCIGWFESIFIVQKKQRWLWEYVPIIGFLGFPRYKLRRSPI